MCEHTPPEVDKLEISESWSMHKGTLHGAPLVVRLNRGVESAVAHPAFAHRVGVAMLLRNPDPNGFPTFEESTQLEAIEDFLADRLCSERQCLYVAAISTGGMREFLFYSSAPATTHAVLDLLVGEITTHHLQYVIEPDPNWEVYRQFA